MGRDRGEQGEIRGRHRGDRKLVKRNRGRGRHRERHVKQRKREEETEGNKEREEGDIGRDRFETEKE